MRKFIEEDKNIEKLLLKSCGIMKKYAQINCVHDYVDETSGCKWYHSAWQYLRVLNCVSAPQWHKEFYCNAIEHAIQNKDSICILISGTADYSMLHLLVEVITKIKCLKADIDIVDKCNSPLLICEWYEQNCKDILEQEQIANFDNITINYIKEDIFRLNNRDKRYDIICSDAFLTRFENKQALKILNIWQQCLLEDGRIITTVRVRNNEEINKDIVSASNDILNFCGKVQNRYRDLIDDANIGSEELNVINHFDIDSSQLDYMANRYIIKMHSHNLGTEEDIQGLFEDNDLEISAESKLDHVEGEISETTYYCIVAKLSNGLKEHQGE